MATVFVTGASGFIGQRLVSMLVRHGHRVVALSRTPQPGTHAATVTWLQADLREPDRYSAALGDADAVVHLAALLAARRPADYFEVNVRGTQTLLESLVRQAGGPRRFVLMSSIAAMGPNHDGAGLRETDPPHPESEYGISKLAAESVACQYRGRAQVTILRPAFVYGRGDHRGSDHLRVMLRPPGRSWHTSITRLSFVHVEDLALACVAALQSPTPSGSCYLVADPSTCGWTDIRAAIESALLRLAGRGAIAEPVADLVLTRIRALDVSGGAAGRPACWACDVSRVRADLGWSGRHSLDDGVFETIQSYCDQGFFAPGRWLGRPTAAV